MSNVISKNRESTKPTLSAAQTAFKKQHYPTMLDFASKFISGEQQAATIVAACFTKLFKEDPAVADSVSAMIRLFEIVEDQCRNPIATKGVSGQKRKLLPLLPKTA